MTPPPNTRDEALEMAAKVCDQMARDADRASDAAYLTQYGNSVGAHERSKFTALVQASRAIRSLKSKPEQENEK